MEVGGALLLCVALAAAVVWLGTWLGMIVRSPDAVMGIAFTVVFPLCLLSSAFVPIDSMPQVLQWVAAYNPVSAMVAAVRELFGNPASSVVKDTWPLDHAVLASVLYCALLLAIMVPLTLRRFRGRTSD